MPCPGSISVSISGRLSRRVKKRGVYWVSMYLSMHLGNSGTNGDTNTWTFGQVAWPNVVFHDVAESFKNWSSRSDFEPIAPVIKRKAGTRNRPILTFPTALILRPIPCRLNYLHTCRIMNFAMKFELYSCCKIPSPMFTGNA